MSLRSERSCLPHLLKLALPPARHPRMLCGGIFMRIGLKTVCALAIAGLVAGLSARLQADPLTVKTEQGKAHGKTINDGKVKAFLGLPYAAAPVGELRWKAPQPPVKWKGARDATRFGARCAQNRVFADIVFEDSGPSE